MTEPEIPVEACLRCAYPLGGTQRLTPGVGEPVEGDVIICEACGCIMLALGVGYRVRHPDDAERAELLADPEVVEVAAAIELARSRALNMGRAQRRAAARRERARWN